MRLVDFGSAKLVAREGAPSEDSLPTRQTSQPLTLQYASPEQLRGAGLSPSSDIYSLGVVLYELLTGEHPHSALGASRASLEASILEEEPVPPGHRGLSPEVATPRSSTTADLTRQLCGEIGAIAMRALARNPTDRYRSALMMSADLDRWLAGPRRRSRSTALD